MMRLAALLCLLALVGCGSDSGGSEPTVEGPAWNHNPSDASAGPTVWGGIDQSFEQCGTGANQSPVDIAEAIPADLPALEFDYPPTPLVVRNTGHVIEASVPEASDLTLTIEGAEYRLVSFHFHASSEHTLDGESYEAEVHLVHRSAGGELAVVAVLLEPSGLPSPLIGQVVDAAPGDAGQEVEFDVGLSPLELLLEFDSQAVVDDYSTYRGSLTTPGCTEGVRWIVLPDILVIRNATVERLHELIADFPGYNGYANNNRPTQPLNGREIQRSTG